MMYRASMNALATSASLDQDQISHYRREGYIILRGIFDPAEVAGFQSESDRLLRSDLVHPENLRTRPRRMPDGQLQVERFDPVIDVSEIFRRVIFDPRLLSPLESIFGERAVLFKDKLIFKVPGMSGYSMHQDYAWWQQQAGSPLPAMPADKILSVMVGIDGADEENGAIQLFPGRHHELLSTPGELRNMTKDEISKLDLSTAVLAETNPGDVVIFHALAPHCSESNRSKRSRRQLYMTYNAASAGDVYEAQQQHYRQYSGCGADNKLYFR